MQYHVMLDDKEFHILGTALIELPFKVVAPLIDKLNQQITEQTRKNADTEQVKEEK